MKTSKLFIALLALATTTSLYAGETPTSKSSASEKKTEKAIQRKMKLHFNVNDYAELICGAKCKEVTLFFKISDNNQVIPLKVMGENEKLNKYVINELNNRPITVKEGEYRNLYRYDLTFAVAKTQI